MHFVIGATDPCWCGSRRPVTECCLKRRSPSRPSVRTGRKNKRCFAASLGDCSPRISKEHYITEGVLKLFGDPLPVGGMPWLEPGERRKIGVSNLTAKILCERHNGLLHGLDQLAIRLMTTFLWSRGNQIADEAVRRSNLHLFSGDDLERWMLKVLCGVVASGNATGSKGVISSWQPPLHWLQILFEGESFPTGWGIYFPLASQEVLVREISAPIAFATIGEDASLGAYIVFDTLKFLLAMAEPPRSRTRTLLEHHTYRPSEFKVTNGHVENRLFFLWERPGDAKAIHLMVQNNQGPWCPQGEAHD